MEAEIKVDNPIESSSVRNKVCKNVVLQHLQTHAIEDSTGTPKKKKKLKPVASNNANGSIDKILNNSRPDEIIQRASFKKNVDTLVLTNECINLRELLMSDSNNFKDEVSRKSSSGKRGLKKLNISKDGINTDFSKSIKTPYTSLVAKHRQDDKFTDENGFKNPFHIQKDSEQIISEISRREGCEGRSEFEIHTQKKFMQTDSQNQDFTRDKIHSHQHKKECKELKAIGDKIYEELNASALGKKYKSNKKCHPVQLERKKSLEAVKGADSGFENTHNNSIKNLYLEKDHQIPQNIKTSQQKCTRGRQDERHLKEKNDSSTIMKSDADFENGNHIISVGNVKNPSKKDKDQTNPSLKRENSRQRRSRRRREERLTGTLLESKECSEAINVLDAQFPNINHNIPDRSQKNSTKEKDQKRQAPYFEAYLSKEKISHGLKRGEMIEGTIRINPKNYEDAYISLPDNNIDIYIGGVRDRNRALNGDIVVVQLYPSSKWRMLHPENILQEKPKPLQISTPGDISDDWIEPPNNSSSIKPQETDNVDINEKISKDDKIIEFAIEPFQVCSTDKELITFNENDSSSDEQDKVVVPENLSDQEHQNSASQGSDHSIDWTQPLEDKIFWQNFDNTHSEGSYDEKSKKREKRTSKYKAVTDSLHVNEVTNLMKCGILVDLSTDEDLPKTEEKIIECSTEEKNCDNVKTWLNLSNESENICQKLFVESSSFSSSMKTESTHDKEIDNSKNNLMPSLTKDDDLVQDSSSINIMDSAVNVLPGKLTENNGELILVQPTLVSLEKYQSQHDANTSLIESLNLDHDIEHSLITESSTSPFQFKYSDFLEEILPLPETAKFEESIGIIDSNDTNLADLNCQINLCQSLDDVIIESASSGSEDCVSQQLFFTNVVSDWVAFSSPVVKNNNQSSIFCRASSKLRKKIRQHRRRLKKTAVELNPQTLPEKMLQKTGKVIYILEKKHSRAAAGHIKLMQERNPKFALFSPVDHRLPRMKVSMNDCPSDFIHRPDVYSKTLFIARIIDWKECSALALGRLEKSLGDAGEIEPETDALLIENDIDFSDFSNEVLNCLPKHLPWCISEEEFKNRRDFRQECIFTIDPATARDMDDAVSCRNIGNGTFEVGVHIADVSYFVLERTPLDAIASQRATSVYLVQKMIPMLPRLLCEELCSLTPGQERLSFSVVWKLTENGEILDEWFGRTIIKSCIKLSYDHAQHMIDHPDEDLNPDEFPSISEEHSMSDVHKKVLQLDVIARHLRKKRFGDGALRLDQVKLMFTLNRETGMPNGYSVYEQKDSHRLIEEFMLLANMAVAHKIYDSFPEKALLRCHAEPNYRLLDEIVDMCSGYGIQLDTASAGSLQESLSEYWGDDIVNQSRCQILTILISKPMQMAKYFCAGCVDNEAKYWHYALNVPLYTHFTSPIRRYADITVHRFLAAALGYRDQLPHSVEEIQKFADRCNDRKYASKRAQELSNELYFAVFVKECGPLEEQGMILGLMDHSFDVLILKLGVIKRVYCNNLPLKDAIFEKIDGRPHLTLLWQEEVVLNYAVEEAQILTIFSLVDVVLTASQEPLKFNATIKHSSVDQKTKDLL